jgi:hypothetical protein
MAGEVTALDLITAALAELGVYSAGESLSSADSAQGLTCLNDMIDSWSNESLMLYAYQTETVTLVVGKYQYTIGAGGDINVARPIRVEFGPGAAFSTDANGNRYPIEVIDRFKWNQFANVSGDVTSNYPQYLWYDSQFPLGTINLTPKPNLAGVVTTFTGYLQLQEFAALTTAISLPLGYSAAIRHNLAVELHPFFGAEGLNPLIAALALKSKGALKRANFKPSEAIYDAEIVSRGQISYNIFTDSPGSVVRGS